MFTGDYFAEQDVPLASFSAKVKLISERCRRKETAGFRIKVMDGRTVVLIVIIAHNQNASPLTTS